MPAPHEYERGFRAMGTDIRVYARSDDAGVVTHLLADVQDLFESEEQRFSRFRSDSELSILNKRGHLNNPSPEMVDVLKRAIRWNTSTSAVFDPLILPDLEAAGYSRSFEHAANFKPAESPRPRRKSDSPLTDSLTINPSRIAVSGRLDPGGIVKGWTVDRAAELLVSLPVYLIDAGGDIRSHAVHGQSPNHVSVEDPHDPDHDREIVELRSHAIATSGVYGRQWNDRDSQFHHLIDPRTGLPSRSDLIAATVIAPTAETAEILAKACVICGTDSALDLLSEFPGSHAVLTTVHGDRITTGAWNDFVAFGPATFRLIGRVA